MIHHGSTKSGRVDAAPTQSPSHCAGRTGRVAQRKNGWKLASCALKGRMPPTFVGGLAGHVARHLLAWHTHLCERRARCSFPRAS